MNDCDAGHKRTRAGGSRRKNFNGEHICKRRALVVQTRSPRKKLHSNGADYLLQGFADCVQPPKHSRMKFNIYGRFDLDIVREGNAWIAYRLEPGKRLRLRELSIPAVLGEDELALFLDDLYHELSRPGQSICRLA